MKSYRVGMRYSITVYQDFEAESEEAAKLQAEDFMGTSEFMDLLSDYDWSAYMEITEVRKNK